MADRNIEGGLAAPYDARTTAFLLTQVGTHASQAFASKVAELGITTSQVGILLTLATFDGSSQGALAKRLGVVAARATVLVDDLEKKELVSRSKTDRRTYSIRLTDLGRRTIDAITRIAEKHDESYFEPFSPDEKAAFRALLEKLAAHHQLSPGAPACRPVVVTPVKPNALTIDD